MANDDDILNLPVPAPDAEPTASERAAAKTFADLVDKTLAGRTPPAMTTDARALLEVATVIRAATGTATLDAAKQRSIVEDALRRGAGANPVPTTLVGVVPLAARRSRRWVPWAVAGTSSVVAAAAVLALWLRKPERVEVPVEQATSEVPLEWRSRPSDALIGPIDRAQAGAAASRIDHIYADRMHGYRERRFARRGGK